MVVAPTLLELQVLVDEEDRRYFKQQEITLFRKEVCVGWKAR